MNKIDQLFKEKLLSHELNPSPDLWDTLEKELYIKNRKKNVGIYIAASIFLFCVGLIYFQQFLSQNSNNNFLESYQSKKTEKKYANTITSLPNSFKNTFTSAQKKTKTIQSKLALNNYTTKEESKANTISVNQIKESSLINPSEAITSHNSVKENITPQNLVAAKLISHDVENSSKKKILIQVDYRKSVPDKKTNINGYIKKITYAANEINKGDISLATLRAAKNDLVELKFLKNKHK